MDFRKFLQHERILWHNHFYPSLLAGIVVAVITVLFEMTVSNVILFASIGASAMILTHTRSHHLTKLHTTLTAYFLAIIISLLLYAAGTQLPVHQSIMVFLAVFLTGLALFLADAFHPPAISASLSFVLLKKVPLDLLWLFLAVLVLFVAIRFVTYVFSQHLSVREFIAEFRRSF